MGYSIKPTNKFHIVDTHHERIDLTVTATDAESALRQHNAIFWPGFSEPDRDRYEVHEAA